MVARIKLNSIRGREAKPAPPIWNLTKTFLQSAVFWFTFLFVLPAIIYRVEGTLNLEAYRFSASLWQTTGLVFFALGSILAITSCIVLALYGEGTPVPLDCPHKLVTRGPYRYVRNPMAVSGIVQGVGIGLFLGSPLVILYVLIGLVIAETFIRPWEEADLERRFGNSYREYREHVSRWFPLSRNSPRMKLMMSKRLLSSKVDCQKWASVALVSAETILRENSHDRFSVALGTDRVQTEALFAKAVQELFAYHIYPPGRVQPTICNPEGRIRKGSVVVQRILVGPIGIEAAVRVTDVFEVHDGKFQRSGFIYATLKGHPERGVAKFEVSHDLSSGQTSFTIETRSSPDNWLAILFHPLTRFIQTRSNRAALTYFKRLVIS